MNQEQLRQKRLSQLRGALEGATNYLAKNPNNQFMVRRYEKILEQIKTVENFKINYKQ